MADEIYSVIAEHSPGVTFAYNLNHKQFTYTNPAFNTLTGLESKPSLEAVLTLFPADEQEYLQTCYEDLLKNGVNNNVECRLLIGNEEKWICLTASLVSNHSEQMIVGYATDITAGNHNLDKLKKFANKKDSILNILSHDLQGPLGIANMLTEGIIFSRRFLNSFLLPAEKVCGRSRAPVWAYQL